MNVNEMSRHINVQSHEYICYHYFSSMINHKNFLIYYFNTYNRKVFNEHGNTICPIIHKELEISNVSDITRDNRTDIDKYDIQMGHISSRCNECYTIYGTNINYKCFYINVWLVLFERYKHASLVTCE